jgi:hypothetical protein
MGDEMKSILLGGILLGDTLRLNDWIAAQGNDLRAYSDSYNRDVVEIFRLDSDLPIIANICLDDFRREALSWVDFENFEREFQEKFPEEDAVSPIVEDLHRPLTRISYRSPKLDISFPAEFICVQPETHLGFKNIASLYKVNFPLPVVNIGSWTDMKPIRGSQVENGRPLRQVAYIIHQARLMVGVDSWATQFAAQIGTPSIKCHFGHWEYDNRSVRELEGGIDLLRPSASEIEDQIHRVLDR